MATVPSTGGPSTTPPTTGSEGASASVTGRVYNASFLDGGDADNNPPRLDPNRQYTFAFYIGAPTPGILPGAPRPLDETLQQLATEQGVDIEIGVHCRFCRVEEVIQRKPLRVGPRGDTELLRFPITPISMGPSKLILTVQYRNNLVEAFEVPVEIGAARATVPSALRPPSGSAPNLAGHETVPPSGILVQLVKSISSDEYRMSYTAANMGIVINGAKSASMGRVQTLTKDTWLGLRKLVKGLGVVGYTTQEIENFEFSPPKRDQLLLELAKIGREMYRTLFLQDPQFAPTMRDIASSVTGPARITIMTDNVYLPWAIVYDGNPDALEAGRVDPKGFWGYRYRIQGWLVDQPTRSVPRTESGYPLSLLFGYYSPEIVLPVPTDKSTQEFLIYRQKQMEFFQKRAPNVQLAIAASEQTFKEALRQSPSPSDVIYVYAHGYGGQKIGEVISPDMQRRGQIVIPDPDDSQIMFTPIPPSPQGLKPDDLQRLQADFDVRLAGNPLVFLNVCEGEAIAAISGENFVRKFMALGASAVITTDAEVWQKFGSEFATRFFERFLDARYTGDANEILWELRREYLDGNGNPFGFLYTGWGYAGFRPKRP
jgi:hypothetical protein